MSPDIVLLFNGFLGGSALPDMFAEGVLNTVDEVEQFLETFDSTLLELDDTVVVKIIVGSFSEPPP